MLKYKYIFSIVLYKNMDDVIEMIESAKKVITSIKIILVNNFYDVSTKEAAQKIAEKYSCDFISTENKGYGAGNNIAAEYAKKHYIFEYFIISNPDIIIKQFDEKSLKKASVPAIYAPQIICISGKQQNPMWVTKSSILERIQYLGEKKNSMLLNYGAIAIRKVQRIIFLKKHLKDKRTKIYAAHGAFCIISTSALELLKKPYEEGMFLFFEEAWLANNAYINDIKSYFVPGIVINHKEDGSMKVSDVNMSKEAKKSVIYYYENRKVKK